MQLQDYGKLIVLLAILLATTVLGGTHAISRTATERVLILELGYILGNGAVVVGRRRGIAPSPVVGSGVPTRKDDLVAELAGELLEQLDRRDAASSPAVKVGPPAEAEA